jgi:hypothetical protein
MALGGALAAIGVHLPWLSVGDVSADGSGVDYMFGGPWTSVAFLLAIAAIGIAIARIAFAAAPAYLEIAAALAGLAIFAIAIARMGPMSEYVAGGVTLGYGWSAMLWGGVIVFATGIYPPVRRRLRRTRQPR